MVRAANKAASKVVNKAANKAVNKAASRAASKAASRVDARAVDKAAVAAAIANSQRADKKTGRVRAPHRDGQRPPGHATRPVSFGLPNTSALWLLSAKLSATSAPDRTFHLSIATACSTAARNCGGLVWALNPMKCLCTCPWRPMT